MCVVRVLRLARRSDHLALNFPKIVTDGFGDMYGMQSTWNGYQYRVLAVRFLQQRRSRLHLFVCLSAALSRREFKRSLAIEKFRRDTYVSR